MPDLRYPVGEFQYAGPAPEDERRKWVLEIAEAPAKLRSAVHGLSPEQLDTPYRTGGWTARQVVHHLADAHMNAYVRFRLTLTELEPVVKPYQEALWAELSDARTAPVELSMQLMDSMHSRWVMLLQSFRAEDWQRVYRHPEMGVVSLEMATAMYAWHGRHHIAHILSIKSNK
jgi:hypothetical protein